MFLLQFDPQHGAQQHRQNLTQPEREPSRTQWWHYSPSKRETLIFSAWMKLKKDVPQKLEKQILKAKMQIK